MSGDIWINKTTINSETSNRVYTVSQHAEKRYWACSCPAWKTRRKCKHLASLGLPADMVPYEPPKKKKKSSFMDYPTHGGPPGNASDWRERFEQSVTGAASSAPADTSLRAIEFEEGDA